MLHKVDPNEHPTLLVQLIDLTQARTSSFSWDFENEWVFQYKSQLVLWTELAWSFRVVPNLGKGPDSG